jgi:hypothetical protein
MTRERVRALLEGVAAGRTPIAAALAALDGEPFEALPFASIDHHRALRQGFPEVVYGEGKTAEQVVAICERILERSGTFLVTRADAGLRAALAARFSTATVNALARTVHQLGESRGEPADPAAVRAVLIVTAGTSDLPVAEEAAVTLTVLGLPVGRLTDVGVAGIHRLLAQQDALRTAGAIIVVAGMDGALASVVGGLVRVPVIAVPTSVGYGASFSGLAALLTMLNSCAAGVTVCNIDNGFGAAVAASRILSA